MAFPLDTNVWVAFMRKQYPTLSERVRAAPPGEIYTCSVVRAELLLGAHKSTDLVKNLALVDAAMGPYSSLPFDDAAADAYGPIRSHLDAIGKPIGALDMLIAAIAIAKDSTLVTNNTREFSRVPGLRIENWQAP